MLWRLKLVAFARIRRKQVNKMRDSAFSRADLNRRTAALCRKDFFLTVPFSHPFQTYWVDTD